VTRKVFHQVVIRAGLILPRRLSGILILGARRRKVDAAIRVRKVGRLVASVRRGDLRRRGSEDENPNHGCDKESPHGPAFPSGFSAHIDLAN
jgi:hypothetical protein